MKKDIRFFDSRYRLIIGLIVILMVILAVRLFVVTVIQHDRWTGEASEQNTKTIMTSAPRGNIYDRNGNLIAYNELAYSVTIVDTLSTDMGDDERNETINAILEQVLEIVEGNGDSVINSFGITLDFSGNYQFSQTNETQRLRFVADVYAC